MRDLKLCVGVFFDGTGNNADNTRLAMSAWVDRGWHLNNPVDPHQLDGALDSMLSLSGPEATSYRNYYTNIYQMSRCYPMRLSPDGVMQIAVYIEGPGTITGKADMVSGLVLGTGSTGILARTTEAIHRVSQALRDVCERLDRETRVNTLCFDIFGFSRGAAAARHFANLICAGDANLTNAVQDGVAGRCQSAKAIIQTRFIGLFDTVAAVGTVENGLDPHSPAPKEYKLSLPAGVAKQVLQIGALHECRYHFPLVSVAPHWPEIILPGVHGDIGGGYFPLETENLFLSRPQAETVLSSTHDEKTRLFFRLSNERNILKNFPAYAIYDQGDQIRTETWCDERLASDARGNFRKRSYAALTLRGRQVKSDWSNVSLHIMMEAARRAGVCLVPDHSREIPDVLSTHYRKALTMVNAAYSGTKVPTYTQEEVNVLANGFIHCSAHWNTIRTDSKGKITGSLAALTRTGFPNQPDTNWQRTIYYYPV